MNSAAFKTGSQIKKLNSFSVLSLYFKAKEAFLNVVRVPSVLSIINMTLLTAWAHVQILMVFHHQQLGDGNNETVGCSVM